MRKKIVVTFLLILAVMISMLLGYLVLVSETENIQKYEADDREEEEEIGQSEVNVGNAKNYVYVDFQGGNSYASVIDDVTFVNVAKERMQVTWKSSDEEIVSQTGKVSRPKQDKDVTITAHILIDGQKLKKEFVLSVIGKTDVHTSEMKDYSVDELVIMNRNDEDFFYEVNDFGYLQSVYGKYCTMKVKSYEDALYSLYHIRSALGITDPFAELQIYDSFTSEYGYTFHFRQVYQGIRVFSNEITVHADKDGNTSYFQSTYYPFPEQVNTKPKYSYKAAKEKFLKEHPSCQVTDGEQEVCLINYY
ncbi:MAG: hypothetical protein K2K70_00825, partial [Lachnospiraceae bacterium]|nr:hypothetical protein [Lachnospiraceae bacterium]